MSDKYDDSNMDTIDNTDNTEITLESILAEYGSGNQKWDTVEVPKERPAEKARKERPVEDAGKERPKRAAPESSGSAPETGAGAHPAGRPAGWVDKAEAGEEKRKALRKVRVTTPPDKDTGAFIPVSEEVTDSAEGVSPYRKYAGIEAVRDRVTETDDGEDAFLEPEEDTAPEYESGGIFRGLMDRFAEAVEKRRKSKEEVAVENSEDESGEEGVYDDETLRPDETSLITASLRYGKSISAYQMRGTAAIILSALMFLASYAYDRGLWLPAFLAGNVPALVGVLLFCQLIVMYMGLHVFAAGLADIFRLRIGVESLIAIACTVSTLDAVQIMISGDYSRGLPYGAAVSFAVGCAILGRKLVRNAMKIGFRTAATASTPYVLTGKYGLQPKEYTLFKTRTGPEGFLRKSQQVDFAEHIYAMATPLLLLMALVFALLAAVSSGGPSGFLHYLAALTAVSASFGSAISYGLPFSTLAKKLMRMGAAIAGWGGAVDIDEADSMIIRDTDVFPVGTVSISGVRVFRKAEVQKVISYTGSVIAALDSGLSKTFEDMLRKQKYPVQKVEDLSCYEGGGVGAAVKGKQVIVGSSNFMKLMGIQLPQNLSLKNALFTAVDNELVGVFTINYVPANSVQEALISILGTKIKPLFAIRDFNVTPVMLRNKFKISTDKIDFLSVDERLGFSNIRPDEYVRPLAVLCREGLWPLAEAVTGGKRLKRIVQYNVIFTIAASLIGQLIVFFFCWGGRTGAVSAANVFTYLFMCLIPVLIMSRGVKNS